METKRPGEIEVQLWRTETRRLKGTSTAARIPTTTPITIPKHTIPPQNTRSPAGSAAARAGVTAAQSFLDAEATPFCSGAYGTVTTPGTLPLRLTPVRRAWEFQISAAWLTLRQSRLPCTSHGQLRLLRLSPAVLHA